MSEASDPSFSTTEVPGGTAVDTALENALKRRADLVKEIEKIDRFVLAYHEFSGEPLPSLDAVAGLSKTVEKATRAASSESSFDAGRPKNPKLDELVPAAIEIIRATGRPMGRKEIHAALAERGLEVLGADPVRTLGAILWRAREHIDSLEGRGYWPKGDPVPPVSLDEPRAALMAQRAARRAQGIPKRT